MTHTNEYDDDDYDLAGMYADSHAKYGSSWLDKAACADAQIDDYYNTYRPKVEVIETCRGCPVKWNCLESVAYVELQISRMNVKNGVVGGLPPAERRRLYEKPRESWPEEQVRLIDAYLKERYKIKDLPKELRDALYPEGI